MKTPRIVLFGYHEAGYAVLDALLADGYAVVGLVTHEPSPDEREWLPLPAAPAERRGLPVLTPQNPNRRRARRAIMELAPDIILSVMYRRLLGPELLALPRLGAFNLHPSLLPRYRGRAPVNWALVRGETEVGVSLHRMVLEADAGAVLDRRTAPVGPLDCAVDLHRRLTPLFVAAIRAALPSIAAGASSERDQDLALASTFGRRGPADGAIDWRWTTRRVLDLVRAVTRPYPGAFAPVAGLPVTIWRAAARSLAAGDARAPGATRTIDGHPAVRAADGEVVLLDWEPRD